MPAPPLVEPRKLWELLLSGSGFRLWSKHRDYVLMSAEMEMSVWDARGRWLWSRPVKPPWSYSIKDGIVRLKSADETSFFSLGG